MVLFLAFVIAVVFWSMIIIIVCMVVSQVENALFKGVENEEHIHRNALFSGRDFYTFRLCLVLR